MKKVLLTIVLALFGVAVSQAVGKAEAAGKWESADVLEKQRNGDVQVRYNLDLQSDGGALFTITSVLKMDLGGGAVGGGKLVVTAQGTWKVDGNDIVIDYDKKSMRVSVPREEIKISGAQNLFKPEDFATILDMASGQVKDSQQTPLKITGVKIQGGNAMSGTVDGKSLSFTRLRK